MTDRIKKRRAGADDLEIGRKIRALRLERGLSQSHLACGIGLTFQQVQKYEKGTNRVAAGRLQRIADMLNVPVTFFYGGMSTRANPKTKRQGGGDPPVFPFMQTRGRGADHAGLRRHRVPLDQVRARRAGRILAGPGEGRRVMKYLLAYFVVGAITAIEITAKWQHDCPRERLRTGSAPWLWQCGRSR